MGSFKTKARAVELLGRKQIRDGVTALGELMKNSYDADAEWIRTEFVTKVDNPYIIICDEGDGMDKDIINNNWLVLGTDSKKSRSNSRTRKNRTLMGEKGIGRLAAARLGEQMLMLTRTSNSEWNMVYINWNIFENPKLYIEEITIPSIFEISFEYLKSNFSSIIENFKKEQSNNLKLQGWKLESENLKSGRDRQIFDLYNRIENQIHNFDVSYNHLLTLCSIIENGKKQGTIILIQDIIEDWDRYLNPNIPQKDREQDFVANKNYVRFASFVSNFSNADNPFNVEIVYNKKPLVFNSDYTEEDYNIYDLKIEGKVRNGKFYGNIMARNADSKILEDCNNELTKGIEVTAGIQDWKKYDCGPYKLKMCHVELSSSNSGLTDEEYSMITQKMQIAGGLSVFRDNVRILPYGEPENDFLNLEARRSKHAGNYLFSHRNMFGKIDINSADNPNLEDKSSREGLIENEYFYYFTKTLENLLINISLDYLSNARKDSKGLRNTYIENNTKAMQDKIKEQETIKQERQLAKEHLISLETKLKEYPLKLKFLEDEIYKYIEEWKFKAEVAQVNDGYEKLSKQLEEFRKLTASKKNDIDNLQHTYIISLSQRFKDSYDDKLTSRVLTYNKELADTIKNLTSKLGMASHEIEQVFLKLIHDWNDIASDNLLDNPIDFINIILEKIKDIDNSINSTIKELNSDIDIKRQHILSEIEPISNIFEKVNKVSHELKSYLNNSELSLLINQTNTSKNELISLISLPPHEIRSHATRIIHSIDEVEKKNYDLLLYTRLKIENEFNGLLTEIQPLLSFLGNTAGNDSLDYLLGSLKLENAQLQTELELINDLANLGLASEVVNHEFNQLFTNVNDSIKHLKRLNMSQGALYWLKQIEVGFRAISDRQSQLSPMYRSYNLPKRPIKLNYMLADLKNFFASTLERYKIDLIIDVDEEIELVLSQSKIYPVLSNLIHNSIYWVIDRDAKQILFHYNELESTLYIEDSGIGISKSTGEKIFSPFFTKKPGGRGLGLTIAKKVLESQNHKIDIVYDSPEKRLSGACFKIVFNLD
ncbi:ATP-binding protein [Proteiniborus sp. MB09-C3]|uniref:ATP-binding protein n=1 Tax=Proteiniborus sp. MB09-C3 TaxID=3050072 RepID=UPI002554AB42|nr:ATP-binding protein [Proteiniborus sp. MB09-C3]WIV11084.1 ATP-binding protein [Proteiniborus sp. MB09-C3]